MYSYRQVRAYAARSSNRYRLPSRLASRGRPRCEARPDRPPGQSRSAFARPRPYLTHRHYGMYTYAMPATTSISMCGPPSGSITTPALGRSSSGASALTSRVSLTRPNRFFLASPKAIRHGPMARTGVTACRTDSGGVGSVDRSLARIASPPHTPQPLSSIRRQGDTGDTRVLAGGRVDVVCRARDSSGYDRARAATRLAPDVRKNTTPNIERHATVLSG